MCVCVCVCSYNFFKVLFVFYLNIYLIHPSKLCIIDLFLKIC